MTIKCFTSTFHSSSTNMYSSEATRQLTLSVCQAVHNANVQIDFYFAVVLYSVNQFPITSIKLMDLTMLVNV